MMISFFILCILLVISFDISLSVYPAKGGVPIEAKQGTHDHIQFENIPDEENYYTHEDVYYVSGEVSPPVDYNDISENYKKKMINFDDIEKINNLKNLNRTSTFQNMQKVYYENNTYNSQLNKSIKKILSIALNVPIHEIKLHDINMLLKKWRQVNKEKKNLTKTYNNEYYFKTVKMHDPHLNRAINTDRTAELATHTGVKNIYNESFISADYLLQLTF
ncbi:hypothetical protein PMALA_043640 [Plasmodium malariae]|uniref:Uncharacterized protein n=2 Tax=Plasmodium malariae TaxID=5858 RepID=A0A1A8WNR8_PLAMA|nr:hypothetical protein PMALA_043640 [Plasmodium malariae]